MLRKDKESGKRPLIMNHNSRLMLNDIRESLSHHLQQREAATAKPDPGQVKPEPSPGSANINDRGGRARRLDYHQQALAQIRDSIKPFQNETHMNGHEEAVTVDRQLLVNLIGMGYDEDVAVRALRLSGNRKEDALELMQSMGSIPDKNGISKNTGLSIYGSKVNRKPSFEEKYRQGSPVSDSASIRSESPGMSVALQNRHLYGLEQRNLPSPGIPSQASNGRDSPPPPVPPRTHRTNLTPPSSGTPPPPPPRTFIDSRLQQQMQLQQQQIQQQQQQFAAPGHVQQMIKRMTPSQRDTNMRPQGLQQAQQAGPVTPPRGISPMAVNRQQHQQFMMQNLSSMRQEQLWNEQEQLNAQLQSMGVSQSTNTSTSNTTMNSPQSQMANMGQLQKMSKYIAAPPPYNSSQRQSPTTALDLPEYRQTPTYDFSSGSSTPSSGAQTPTSVSKTLPQQVPPRPAPVQAWGAKQTPIIMQSVKSREVQKPVLQTATAPTSPASVPSQTHYTTAVHTHVSGSPQGGLQNTSPAQRNLHIQIRKNMNGHNGAGAPSQYTVQQPGQSIQIQIKNQHLPQYNDIGQITATVQAPPGMEVQYQSHIQRKMSPGYDTASSTPRSNSPVPRGANQSPMSVISTTSTPSTNSDIPDKPPPPYPGKFQTVQESEPELEQLGAAVNVGEEVGGEKHRCTSPIPERKPEMLKKDNERSDSKVRNYSPQAFKFYMEQHVENVLKSHQQRINRRVQLESEMSKVGLSEQAQCQMRRMLNQKESNYIRLKRAKMNKSMFDKLKTLGIGAFGEVALVRKRDDTGRLYAMKTLRKSDVLRRNQVAHVKAERDILAEADNEWVVKLYYSFQDTDNLYFVMDYIPGGDMMSLLIKFGIFPEDLAKFYIAELVLAIESVHKMGFIHRDIKPDNILIDRDGHIKLTDFGLCTGFRWTHNSKYYQKDGHARQDSMNPESWDEAFNCDCYSKPQEILKPLARRKHKEHQRCLAHSLVGTPNYIAPEVLLRSGYTSCCDWWSVGVILYEMLVGQPPFLANTPGETQYKVINWRTSLKIPREATLSNESTDLVLRLCCGSEERLGNRGADEVKKHVFFNGLCFDGLRRTKAPYKPKIRFATDTSNFDDIEDDKLSRQDSDMLTLENGKHPEHAFFEFTFRRFFDDGGHPYATPRVGEGGQNTTATAGDGKDESKGPVYV